MIALFDCFLSLILARKFSVEMVQPLVREMDDKSQFDQSIIDGLFENGVSSPVDFLQYYSVMSCVIQG